MAVDLRKYYKILGLNFGASQSQIKKAYHALAKEKHPDKIQQKLGRPATATETEAWKPIQEAYDILTGKTSPLGGGGGSTPDNPEPETCDRCGKKYPFEEKFPKHKKSEKGESSECYWFCSKKCYDCFNVCDICKKLEKLSPAEEKVEKNWRKKGWGIKSGKVTCSSKCRQGKGNQNNSDPNSLPNCNHCGNKFRVDHINEKGEGVYFTFSYKGRNEIFCSAQCREEWGKVNLRDQGSGDVETQQTDTKTDGNKGQGTGDETEGDTSDNNSDQSNSDFNEGSDINELPENIQEIARLPLPQAQQKSEQEIKKLLKDNALSEQELNKEDWLGGKDWKDYLKSLDTPQKVAEFTHKIRQSILKRALANPTSNEDKKPENNFILPAVIIIISLLFLTTLIIIIRKRRQRRF